ncbi:hypothetical protein EB796_011166 [Bugula neritina]|uniref:Fibrillar collagen NC1 domain-containing protein n=1 Tax=Bugula neritina TaxID=10212 RepID=A0A7J7JXA3_BUGNE|nr:hypothetical protein EB796_011166 [Bugula neritina]
MTNCFYDARSFASFFLLICNIACLWGFLTTTYEFNPRATLISDFVVFQIPSEALTVIEIDTKTTTHLPIIDIAPGDIWTTHKEFGVQLGEVCFS